MEEKIGSSDTSIESNATIKIDKQQNIHNLSSSDEQDSNVETHTEANMGKAETMSNVLKIAHLTTKIKPTNTGNETSHTCCQETSELILKEFRILSQQLGTLHGLVIEMRTPKERIYNIQVPFTTLNEFDTFDDALKDNSSLKSELVKYRSGNPVETERYYKAIGRVLNNAKHWENGRETKKATN
ncbi:hypothetical protein PV325_003196 [Microctonus aethiopoides]|uniref:Uncharacterized protein n=1 Tax=Microctonus aethiopoides TaxID=144406 RepID=A0AA39C994_9HYME|nr:hypothetical protein PV325_003196 [Microctonus aethiopoides]KAK0160271.1 hypothetical protein PV328_007699 [Microctonus aethiopoides]